MSGWLTALRIARRQLRRAKGRSALVVALIGLPVWGLSFLAVSYDMFTLTAEERLAREIGAADAQLRRVADGPVRQDATGGVLEAPVGPPAGEGDGPAETVSTQLTADRTQLTAGQLRQLLPTVRRATLHWRGQVRAATATGIGTLNAEVLDLTNPLVRGIARLTAGRAPAGPDEVALTGSAATRLGATIGDRVELVESDDQHPAGRYRVTGLVEFPGRVASDRLVRRFPMLGDLTGLGPQEVGYQATMVFHPDGLPGPAEEAGWLVATSEPVTWEQVTELNRLGLVAYARSVALNPPAAAPQPETGGVAGAAFGAGVLVIGLAVLEVVLLAGPAFAVGARRRQRELALVAAGGGTQAQLRRLVLADGVLLGALGAVVGIALGIATALAARPLVEEYLVGARAGGYRVFPLALLGIAAVAVGTGLLAALAPAYTVARQPVVAALAGRRGSTGVRKRWPFLGLAMVALGVAVAGVGAWRVLAPVVLAGLLVGQLGLVLCTPALIGLVARLGSRLPVAPRVALRDTARNRSAAAPAVSAIMAAVTGAAAAGVVVLSVVAGAPQWTSYPPGTVVASVPVGESGGQDPPAGSTAAAERAARAAAERAARATLPVDQVSQVSRPLCGEDGPCVVQAVVPDQQHCPYWDRPHQLSPAEQRAASQDPRCANELGPEVVAELVDDGSALAVLTGADPRRLAEAAAVLRDGGVVVTDRRLLRDGGQVRVNDVRLDPTGEKPRSELDVPGYLLPVDFRGLGVILSPGAVRALGLAVTPGSVVVSTTRMPTQAEEDAFEAELVAGGGFGFVVREQDAGVAPALIGLAVAAGLVALGAAAIATGLAAADRRPDLATLGAVGASPRVRRLLALSQSAVIAGLGTGLGLVVGVGAAVAALVGLNQRYASTWPSPDPIPVIVPWPQLAVLVVVPVVAMLGAGLLTRSRLPIERRL